MNLESRKLFIIFMLYCCLLYTCGTFGRIVEDLSDRLLKIEDKTTPSKFKDKNWTGGRASQSGHTYLKGRVDYLVNKYAKRYGHTPALIHALMKHESLSHPSVKYNYEKARVVRSSAGAVGFMQVMPIHAKLKGLPVSALEDPEFNIKLGCAILADQKLIVKARGLKNIVPEALRQYNQGQGGKNWLSHRSNYRNWNKYVWPIMADSEVMICQL